MSSCTVGNNIPAFRVSGSFCSIEAQYSMSSGAVATVINDGRLFVLAEFASMLLGARGVDSDVSPCYCCMYVALCPSG